MFGCSSTFGSYPFGSPDVLVLWHAGRLHVNLMFQGLQWVVVGADVLLYLFDLAWVPIVAPPLFSPNRTSRTPQFASEVMMLEQDFKTPTTKSQVPDQTRWSTT